MLKVYIVDDEIMALNNLEILLKDFPDVEITLKTTNPFEALRRAVVEKPEIIFIDINMPGMNGMQYAERLYKENDYTKLIFATAYSEYAIDSFAYNTLDYILKPVTHEKLKRSMTKYGKQRQDIAAAAPPTQKLSMNFMAFSNERYYIIALEDAQYIYVANRKLTLVCDDKPYQLKHDINYWEKKLSPHGWFRCHRAYLINLSQIGMIEPLSNSVFYVQMKNCTEKISVSRTYSVQFLNLVQM